MPCPRDQALSGGMVPSRQHIWTTSHPPGVRMPCLGALGEQGISIFGFLLPVLLLSSILTEGLSCHLSLILSASQQTIVQCQAPGGPKPTDRGFVPLRPLDFGCFISAPSVTCPACTSFMSGSELHLPGPGPGPSNSSFQQTSWTNPTSCFLST